MRCPCRSKVHASSRALTCRFAVKLTRKNSHSISRLSGVSTAVTACCQGGIWTQARLPCIRRQPTCTLSQNDVVVRKHSAQSLQVSLSDSTRHCRRLRSPAHAEAVSSILHKSDFKSSVLRQPCYKTDTTSKLPAHTLRTRLFMPRCTPILVLRYADATTARHTNQLIPVYCAPDRRRQDRNGHTPIQCQEQRLHVGWQPCVACMWAGSRALASCRAA